jgi:hypothetical protein
MTDTNDFKDYKKCGTCKISLPLTKFSRKRNDMYNKTCNYCLNKSKRYYKHNKCPHDIYIYNCPSCSEIRKNKSVIKMS